MARGKKSSKKKENNQNGDTAKINDAIVDEVTKAVKQLSVKEKKTSKDKTKRRNITPYQGNKQCFGLYECPKCRNEWASSHSWANTWQKCLECNSQVYPHQQWPKKKRGSKKDDKPHRQDLCEKCQLIGNYCGILRQKR